MNESSKKEADLVFYEIEKLLDVFSADEMENTLFEVFEEANLHSNVIYDEKEKRKLLHETLRDVFRIISKKQIT